MTQLGEILASGLTTGAIYGIVALGYAIGFSATRVINFAHGELLMVAVMVTSAVAASSAPVVVAIAAGLGAAVAVAAIQYLITIRPVTGNPAFGFAWLVTTLGAAIVIESIAGMIWGSQSHDFPSLLHGHNIHIGQVVVSWQQLLGLGVALALGVGLELVRRRSRVGSVMSAVAFDPEMATAVGVNRERAAFGAFLAAGLLAGVAGILVAPIAFANAYMGIGYGIKGFIAMMIGGLGSLTGAIAGGLVLGLAEAAAATWIGSGAVDWFPFAVLVAVLLVLPSGLFRGSAVEAPT